MTPKQKKFCHEYLKDTNATQAAIRAGYSEKTAYSTGQRQLKNVEVKNYIKERMEKMQKSSIASAEEVLEYLTSVARGESESEIVINRGIGNGLTEIAHVKKKPDEKDRLKAAELLGKRYALYTDNVAATVQPSEKFIDIVKQLGGK